MGPATVARPVHLPVPARTAPTPRPSRRSQRTKLVCRFLRQFSYPGGIPSHFAPGPRAPSTRWWAGLRSVPRLRRHHGQPEPVCPSHRRRRRAETARWLPAGSQQAREPRTDGIVLPILHLNGYKIANPTIPTVASPTKSSTSSSTAWLQAYEFVAGFDDGDHVHHRHLRRKTGRPSGTRSATSRPPLRPTACPSVLCDADLPHPEGIAEVHRPRQEDRGLLAFPPVRLSRPRHRFEVLKNWLESYKPEELFDASRCCQDDVRAFMPRQAAYRCQRTPTVV